MLASLLLHPPASGFVSNGCAPPPPPPSALPRNPSTASLPRYNTTDPVPPARFNNPVRNYSGGGSTERMNRGLAFVLKRIQPLDAGAVPIPKQRHHNQQQLGHPSPSPAVSSPAVAPMPRRRRRLEQKFSALESVSQCLEKLVHNFLEGDSSGGEETRPCAASAAAGAVAAPSCSSSRCGRSRCNCFLSNGCCEEESPEDDIFDLRPVRSPPLPPPIEASVVIKNLLLHTTPLEKSLLSDVSTVLDKTKHKPPPPSSSGSSAFRSKTLLLATLVEGLVYLSHDASICRSRWPRTASVNAGQHEYADVLFPCGERLIVDVDFKSEFQVAHPTQEYRAVLALLPSVFVATPERLKQVVAVAALAARRSLSKKGFHVAPWRTELYMQAKWLSPGHQRVSVSTALASAAAPVAVVADAGCWPNFGAVATASVVTVAHRSRPARVAPAVADQDHPLVRGVNAKPPPSAPPRSRPAQPPPAAMRRVGWAVPGPGCII